MATLLSLSISVLVGLLLSRLAKLAKLPAVTAYLVAGILVGPFCLGAFGVEGLGFTSLEQVDSFSLLCDVALGFIAFSIGNEFRLSQLKQIGKQATIIGIFQAVITTVIVDIALIIFHLLFPQVLSLPAAIVLGAVASATAPAATLMVVKQYKAKGKLTDILLPVVALDDAVGLVLFAVSFGVAKALGAGSPDVISVLVEPLLEVILSLGLGFIMGQLFTFVEQFFHSRSKRLTISIAFVMLTVGLSMIKFHIGPVHCGFSLLLVCMMTGTIFCNICSTSEELMSRIDSWTMPLNILFFVISGAELDLQVVANPITLLVGVIYIASRSLGKYYGSVASCRLTRQTKPITDNLGITLLPQAGVALGMAMTASTLPGGDLTRNVVLFSVLIYELVGPALTKRSLLAVGEIQPEGRKSHRTHNSPTPRARHR